ncbi:MAG: DarT ssDNA thymidine ADP-ribosyltransferase family protein [bacterium]
MKLRDGHTAVLRMVHLDNLAVYLARAALHAPGCWPADGHGWRTTHRGDVQQRRATAVVSRGPGGVLLDYVPFYFGPRSPMLYQLHTGQVAGYTDSQGSLVYLVASAQEIAAAGVGFVFFDGHALAGLSACYDDLAALDRLDWPTIETRQWAGARINPDMQRKQTGEVPRPPLRAVGARARDRGARHRRRGASAGTLRALPGDFSEADPPDADVVLLAVMQMRTGTGNLLEAPTEVLVNTVNCVGVMGKGIALQFKKAWPAMFDAYARAAKAGEVVPGRMHVYETHGLVGPRLIINFPTKRHWRADSKMQDIEAGLVDLVATIRRHGIRSIAIPPLGAGLGGLPWPAVRERIVAALAPIDDLDVWLWEPGFAPVAADRLDATERPEMTGPRAMILALMGRFPVLDHDVTHLDAQKLAYFLQFAGAPLGLRFKPQMYGPYADGLYHLLQRLESHHITGLIDRRPFAPLHVAQASLAEAEAWLAASAADRAPFERVARLIEGFETLYSMELLATVHWVVCHEAGAADDIDHCINAVHRWSDRKAKLMQPRHIALAWERLRAQGWFTSSADAISAS